MKDIDTFQFHSSAGDQSQGNTRQWTDVLSPTPSDGSETAYEYKLDGVIITNHGVSGSEAQKASLLLPSVQSAIEAVDDTTDGTLWDSFLIG